MEPSENGDFPPKSVEFVETATKTVTETSDLPPKKLARQLDYKDFNGLSTIMDSPSMEHPKSRLKPWQGQRQPILEPLRLLNLLPLHTLSTASSESQPRAKIEVKDGTGKDHKQCHCKQSKCLKLYCVCFASGTNCDGCNCVDCHNNVENEATRRAAIEITLDRNPNAFRPKIASSPHRTLENGDEAKDSSVVGKHNKGCHCKKSGCLKKYCECFQAKILCSENCKCVDCKNFEGSEERSVVFHGNHSNTTACIQQANAAITGAIGFSGYCSSQTPRKRKGQELFLGSNGEDPPNQRRAQYQQVNHRKASDTSSASSVVPVGHIISSAVSGSSKFTYRSLLADIIGLQDMRELCSVLVVVSEAAKILADRNGTADMQRVREYRTASSLAAQDRENGLEGPDIQKAVPNDHLSGNEADIMGADDSRSNGADVQKGSTISPRTLALMCDEKETLLMAAASPDRVLNPACNTDVYVEQERCVLASFRNFLNRLITRGSIKETKCFLSARGETEGQQESVCNGIVKARTETVSEKETISNGIIKAHGPDNAENAS